MIGDNYFVGLTGGSPSAVSAASFVVFAVVMAVANASRTALRSCCVFAASCATLRASIASLILELKFLTISSRASL